MEAIPEKKSRLARPSFWCALLILSCLIVGAVFSNLEHNRPFLLLFMVGATGTLALSTIFIALGLLAYWTNYRGPRSAAGKAAAKRRIEFGIVGLLLIPIMSVFIPNRDFSMRPAAYEASAVGSLRTIRIATDMYANAHPERGFPASLRDLTEFVDNNLASGQKTGYIFTYTPRSTHHDGKLDAYDVIAEPAVPHTTGNRYFFADETGVISFSLSRDPSGKKPL